MPTYYADYTSEEVNDLLRQHSLLLPVGAIEQHGPRFLYQLISILPQRLRKNYLDDTVVLLHQVLVMLHAHNHTVVVGHHFQELFMFEEMC